MILICPSCSAKFMISSEALGADGREVRCGKCGHMWFQEGERDSLDDLPRHEPEDDNIDIGFVPHKEEPQPIPEAFKPRAEPASKPSSSKPKKEIKIASPIQKQIAGLLVALAIVLVIFYALVAMKDSLGRSIPFMGAAYEKMGFHLQKVEPQIAIDRLRLTKEGKKILGSMHLINLTSEDVSIGKVTADLIDFDYKSIKTIDVPFADKTLKGESSNKVDFSFDDVPKDAVSVKVKISQ